MTRKIKAKDIKPGMEIEWTDNDWTYSGTISEVLRSGCSQPSMSLRNTGQVWEYVDLDQEVTVLKEAQPEEPTSGQGEPRKWGSLADIPDAVVSVEDREGDQIELVMAAGQTQWVYTSHNKYFGLQPTDAEGPFIEVLS